ncbi:MAG TPA: ATP-dependent RecD-like DNA helicase [Thermoanaerobaculia bacterium]|nr:ATP-dependent RecD-like DNA helicase [Thermoanaerobaculia bacterium]
MRSPEGQAPPAPSDGVTGQVERVTFHSDESGFCVVKVSVRGRKELCTVVGTVPAVSVGEWLSATGQWTIDPRHGPQFKADQIRTSSPENAEGIERYLASGLIRGIGPAFAARLVKKFGKDVFTVIAEKPGRLREVAGIGRSRQRAITESFRAQKVVREIMVFLHSHGVSSSRAYRIFKTYGEHAIETVQADPYCLARDIRGIGFKTADAIAARVGVAPSSELRARAGVEFTLQELTHDGHCAYPRGDLAKRASDLLGIPAGLTDAAIAHGIASKRLAEHPGPDGAPLVYLAPLDDAERELAKSLAGLSRRPHPLPPVDSAKAADWVEMKVGLTLSATQRAALAKALTAKVMVITGGPGVGKTTLVDSIVKIFRAKKREVVLCAPTGRAAKRLSETSGLEAKTIHRLLEFDPASLAFKHDAAHPLKGDLFVVDEASMLDVTLCQQLVRAVPPAAALLFVGDVDQLPSVGPGSVLRDVIDSGTVPVLRLTEVFRQAARSAIITNAHRINRGVLPVFPESGVKSETSDFYFVEADEPEEGVARVIQLVTEAIPRRFRLNPREDVQVLCPMQKGELGARNLNVKLQEALNPSGESVDRFGWTFRVGDRVMQTVNDYEKNVFNGDIGRVRSIDAGEQEVTVAFDGRSVAYGFGELDELILAYAATVHKSQGSEYPAVVVPIHSQHYVMLQRNLLYTAVTRARKLVVLVGTKSALAIATNRVSSRRRITTLKERLVEAAARPALF